MAVRVGVDVGGTFTKAVACDALTGEVLTSSAVATTHEAATGVAEGVAHALSAIADRITAGGWGPVLMVGHSTTQAVNALLEGDTSVVGVLGIGRKPDLRRARRRTHVGEVQLAPGRTLQTRHEFIDSSQGLTRASIRGGLEKLADAGAEVVAVSEAFGVEDARGECMALEAAAEMGMAASGGHELTGLYGLEMRTVTCALNASILPTALATAHVVGGAVARSMAGAPLLIMKGDGGAAGLDAMRRHPLLTAFSGPAASVAGALRHLLVRNGVVVEVGGTSTNVSAVREGRPLLSYVRVLDHVTCVRSLDVRVVGLGGGSLVRMGRRLGRMHIEDVGPRSAHIAGLPYCCFARPDELTGAELALVSPRPGDAPDYAILRTPSGRSFAVTVTCAANALGAVPEDTYARADRLSARCGLEAVGRALGMDVDTAARRVCDVAAAKVQAVVGELSEEARLREPTLIGLGGGAGAVVPGLGERMRLESRVPAHAEVISSIGDALSLVRVEIERSLPSASAAALARLHDEVREAAIAQGASPATVQVESAAVPEKRAVRLSASGSVALEAGALPQDADADDEALWLVAKQELGEDAERVFDNRFYAAFATNGGPRRSYVVVDRRGSVAARGDGTVLIGPAHDVADDLSSELTRRVRHFGPLSVAPAVKVLRGARLLDLSVFSSADDVLVAARAECDGSADEPVGVFIDR